MRLLLDEDSQGKALVRLLQDAGHDVETVYGAGLASEPDPVVLGYAKRTGRILLTRNAEDFELLHEMNRSHFGILVEYQNNDPSKNLSFEQIVDAIRKIEESGWLVAGEFVSINAWQ